MGRRAGRVAVGLEMGFSMRRLIALCLLALTLPLGVAGAARAEKIGAPARSSQTASAENFGLAPRSPKADVYILSFGLWGPQSVFESEARGAASILESKFGSKGRSIVRSNTKRRGSATPATLMAASQAVGRVLDPDKDVALLVLTSHGGPAGVGLVTPRDERVVTPRDVGRLLDATGAKYRVLIVSACYSGIFADKLADPNTLVITAASADRSSFGCRDGAAWTYFGDAFFNKSLRTATTLDAAFEKARGLVTQREIREGFEPSNPQIAGGARVLEVLANR
ncbi:C13 family peptidase [Microvirga antarctica]|uniref:C13 family peptidase n=1 Tax=Microvirga antarctica TaxID=2819233 RepID=UPI001FEA0930|nr:C13 family peptidase [Microvirga antarctica]